jgi:hypothetical protein
MTGDCNCSEFGRWSDAWEFEHAAQVLTITTFDAGQAAQAIESQQ